MEGGRDMLLSTVYCISKFKQYYCICSSEVLAPGGNTSETLPSQKKKKVAESKNGKATRQCSDRGEVRLRCTRYDVDQVTRWDTLLMTMLYDWHSKDSDMMHDDVWW